MQRRKFIKKTSLLSMGLGITNNALSNVQKQKVNLNMKFELCIYFDLKEMIEKFLE